MEFFLSLPASRWEGEDEGEGGFKSQKLQHTLKHPHPTLSLALEARGRGKNTIKLIYDSVDTSHLECGVIHF